MPGSLASWPTLDREALRSLDADAAVLILPGAADATLAEAEANWRAADLAVPWEAVEVVTDDYAMVPGWRVTELAGRLRDAAGRADVKE